MEIAALVAIGVGGYNLTSGVVAWVLGIGLALAAAVAWGTFNVPGDESRSGAAPVAVKGAIRLGLELLFFGLAVVLLWPVTAVGAGALGAAVLVHYLLSMDRIRWLLAN